MRDEELEPVDEYQDQESENVYDADNLEAMEEDDEIDPLEEGFMRGYDEESVLRCNWTGQELGDTFVTMEIEGKIFRFVNKKAMQEFLDDQI